MKNIGTVTFKREIRNLWFWNKKPFSEGQAFTDLCLEVNFDDRTYKDRAGKVITCKRMESTRSARSWAQAWGWTVPKTMRFLRKLHENGIIELNSTRQTLHVRLLDIVVYKKERYTSVTANVTANVTRNNDNKQDVSIDSVTQNVTQNVTDNKTIYKQYILENIPENGKIQQDENSKADSRVKELIKYFSARFEKTFPANKYENQNDLAILSGFFEEKLKKNDVDFLKKKIDLFIVPDQSKWGFDAILFKSRFDKLIVKKQREY